MTSYSTYCAGRIRFVDGDLTPSDDEVRGEQRDQLVNCLASGAARALLDTVRDLHKDSAEPYAEEWHSEAEGWELEALDDDARAKVREVVGQFVDANVPYILLLADHIADEAEAGPIWRGDLSMALYRVGYLLGFQCAGQGVGLSDYGVASGYRLDAWVRSHVAHVFEDTYIDSSEEPCLLHMG